MKCQLYGNISIDALKPYSTRTRAKAPVNFEEAAHLVGKLKKGRIIRTAQRVKRIRPHRIALPHNLMPRRVHLLDDGRQYFPHPVAAHGAHQGDPARPEMWIQPPDVLDGFFGQGTGADLKADRIIGGLRERDVRPFLFPASLPQPEKVGRQIRRDRVWGLLGARRRPLVVAGQHLMAREDPCGAQGVSSTGQAAMKRITRSIRRASAAYRAPASVVRTNSWFHRCTWRTSATPAVSVIARTMFSAVTECASRASP